MRRRILPLLVLATCCLLLVCAGAIGVVRELGNGSAGRGFCLAGLSCAAGGAGLVALFRRFLGQIERDLHEKQAALTAANVTLEQRVERRTLEIARSMAEKSPVTLAIAKRALRAALEMPLSAGLAHERDLFALAFATEDKEEGVRAFLEKRRPEWKGR